MNILDKKSLVLLVATLATIAQAGLAGVAFLARRTAEQDVKTERGLTANYAAQLLTSTVNAVVEPSRPAVPHAVLQTSADVAGTLRAIQTVSDQVGVTLATAKASPSNTPGRQTFVITGRGTPEQVCSFVAGIEQHERLIVIENGKVLPGTADEMNFELGLSTHHTGGAR